MPGTTSLNSKHTTHHMRKRHGYNDCATNPCRATQICNSGKPNNSAPASFGFPEFACFAETSQMRIFVGRVFDAKLKRCALYVLSDCITRPQKPCYLPCFPLLGIGCRVRRLDQLEHSVL